MASILPFDNAVLGSTTITTALMVAGSGSASETGSDKSTTTADGRIHYDREKINSSASLEAIGDYTDATTAAGLGVTCTLLDDEAEVKTGTGLVTAVYNASSKTTSFSITYDPST